MRDILIKHGYDKYIFTIDEHDYDMFMHCLNISNFPASLKRNLNYYNIKYKVREILA